MRQSPSLKAARSSNSQRDSHYRPRSVCTSRSLTGGGSTSSLPRVVVGREIHDWRSSRRGIRSSRDSVWVTLILLARVSPTTYLLLRRRDSRTRRLQEERARRNRRVCNRNVTRRHPGRAMCRTRSAPGQWATKTTAAGIVKERSQKRSAALGQKAGVQE